MAARLPGQESNHDVIIEKVHFTHNDSHEAMLSARSYWLEKRSKYIASVFCSTLLLLGFAPVISINPHPRHLLYFLQVYWFQMTGVLNFGFAAVCVDNNRKCLNWHGILQTTA